MLYSVFRASWRVAHYLCLLAFLTVAFDVGRDCGLDFSLWLVSWYVATVTLRRVFSQQGPVKVMVIISKTQTASPTNNNNTGRER